MLDFRIKTFLELCRLKNYTKTAQHLHITQPAVTQHIHYLEKEYGVPLFEHDAKRFTLTPQGRLLYWSAQTMEADSRKIRELMGRPVTTSRLLSFGATLSIGEFVMPPLLAEYLNQNPECRVSMLVENTSSLMRKLDQGEIDFAVIEGSFDKNVYSHVLFSVERFVAVCAPDFPLAGRTAVMDELVNYPLIIREKGSGTRSIFETILTEHSLTLEQFERVSEIGSFKVIKHLVRSGFGVTFVYEPVVRRELMEGALEEVRLDRFSAEREFNMVYLKGSIFEQDYLHFYRFCMEAGGNPIQMESET